jgi:Mg/Co/Ni transporter MgtE
MVAFLWQDNIWLEVAVGAALTAKRLVPDCNEGDLPTVLKRLRIEPSLVFCIR